MPLTHLGTFFILFASIFVATIYFFQQDYHLMLAYLTAGISWFVVATYEYNERAFSRAIQAIIARQEQNPEDDEQ